MLKNQSLDINYLEDLDFDYITLAQSPAEVDMLRFLALYSLDKNFVFHHSHLPRLKETNPWDFYDKIYDDDVSIGYEIKNKISEIFSKLKFENELSLNVSEKYLAPYHPLLNNLPPLMVKNNQINFAELKCFKITEAQPYLDLKYQYMTTESNLKSQIDDLNHIKDKNNRLNKIVYVKRIQNHSYFKELNGQRGVFAKADIKAGTIIDYYSGEYNEYPSLMPPILCTWRVQKSHSWFMNFYRHSKIFRFNGWTDAFILGNMMKLVNSCYNGQKINHNIGNIGCYFFHFKSKQTYLSLPVYVAIKDIYKNTELLAYYYVGDYQKHRVYGIE